MVALHSSYTSLARGSGATVPPSDVSFTTEQDRVFALVQSLRERDISTYEHSRRVAVYAQRLGRALGADKASLRQYGLLGLLHDIGKMWVGDILTKDGRLTDEEFRRIQSHAIFGQRMILGYDLREFYATAVRHHHEAFDGSGYPDHLVGTAIPLAARVIALVDAFDVITSDRPYKAAASATAAIAEMRRCAGQQFDPHLVELFIEQIASQREFIINQRICPVHWARRGNSWYQITGASV